MLLNLTAVLTLLPAAALPLRREGGRDAVFWAALAVGLLGPGAVVLAEFAGSWKAGLAPALWLSVAVTLVAFAAVAGRSATMAGLGPLIGPYLLLVALLALAWGSAPLRPAAQPLSPAALAHVGTSILTYALANLAAVAGLAVYLQERALKRRRPTTLTRRLPAMAEAEALQTRLLVASVLVLGCGVLSGMALLYRETGQWLRLDHKTVLSLGAFVVLAGLAAVNLGGGLGGRRVARLLLLGWLLLTLAYPGVKFVTDVVLQRA
ncbi:MAG: cytochrome c biogenesis protein CcsA [Thalassobaculales bacterium]